MIINKYPDNLVSKNNLFAIYTMPDMSWCQILLNTIDHENLQKFPLFLSKRKFL